MQAKLKQLVVLLLGWCFIVLGIIGLFLPVLQGVLFLLIGLFILSSQYAWAHQILRKLRSRFPTLGRRSDEAAQKAHRALARLFGHQPDTGRRRESKESQAAGHDSECMSGASCASRGPAPNLAVPNSGSSGIEQPVKISGLNRGVTTDSSRDNEPMNQ